MGSTPIFTKSSILREISKLAHWQTDCKEGIPKALFKIVGMKNFGIVVIVLGIIMTTLTGFNIITKKKVADLGSVEITKTEKTPVYWSPITGGILIVVGLVLVVAGNKK